jgi:NitT/TauT family transport system substrate-binding protein
MNREHCDRFGRREFVRELSLVGAAGALGLNPARVAAEPPPETKTLTILKRPILCNAPQYVAEELLRSEGFDDVRYRPVPFERVEEALSGGEGDLSMVYAPSAVTRIDAGDTIVLVAGVHVGCVEVFGNDRVRTIKDLRGKTIVVNELGKTLYAFLASIMANVGLNPTRDVTWLARPLAEWEQAFVQGEIDALLATPPLAQQLRTKKLGHVILNTTTDRPWSQYFCCLVGANREFVRKHPVATKRAVRAILKAANLCATEPERVARSLVDRGFTPRYDYAVQTMNELPYGKWREYDAADTIRFYSLRLHEAGMIKSSPQKILAQGTDWRFLNGLKKELKG